MGKNFLRELLCDLLNATHFGWEHYQMKRVTFMHKIHYKYCMVRYLMSKGT